MKRGWGRMVAHGSFRYQNSSVDPVYGAKLGGTFSIGRASREGNQIGRRDGHAQGQSERHHDELRSTRNRGAAHPDALLDGRLRLLRVPGGRVRQALYVYLRGLTGDGRNRQTRGLVFD